MIRLDLVSSDLTFSSWFKLVQSFVTPHQCALDFLQPPSHLFRHDQTRPCMIRLKPHLNTRTFIGNQSKSTRNIRRKKKKKANARAWSDLISLFPYQTCVCGAIMCYVCKQPVAGYDHFSDRTCPLWTPDLAGLHGRNLAAAQQQARTEILAQNPGIDLDYLLATKPPKWSRSRSESRSPHPPHPPGRGKKKITRKYKKIR